MKTLTRLAVGAVVSLWLTAPVLAQDAAKSKAPQPGKQGRRGGDATPSWLMPPVQGPNLHYKTFDSKLAGEKVSYVIYLPTEYESSPNKKYPVVYWLHGIGGSQQGVPGMAQKLTKAIDEKVAPPLIVVYVNGMIRSGWRDGEYPVESVAFKELMPHIETTYRTIATREGRMIEGFSMGGGGAANWGFKYPDLFGSISIIDGALRSAEGEGGVAKTAERVVDKLKGRTSIRIVTRTTGLATANEKLHHDLEALGLVSELHKIEGPHSPGPLYDGLGDKNWAFYKKAFEAALAAEK